MKKNSSVHLKLVSDQSGDIVWEPRKIPLMKESLGITRRAVLARRAMASPMDIRSSSRPQEDLDDLYPNTVWPNFNLFGLTFCAWLIITGLVLLVGKWL
jgi:hypothetical protein